ncbi:MAG: 50S ribosomal protein L10 [Candidatus Bilamarchaeaceae archaeon]
MAKIPADVNRPNVKKKAKEVEEVLAQMKNYKTTALLSLEKLPDSLFQMLRKKVTEEGGKVKMLRKAVLTRILQSNQKLATKIEYANKPTAIILTNKSPYELNKLFKQNTKKRAAKIDEIAPFDIVVPEGETDLAPGPALSELKSAGINAQIKGGKIVVAKDSVIAKTGEKINAQKAKALQTLGIKPFTIKANLIFAYDGEYVYEKSLLDIDETLPMDLVNAEQNAFNLSVNAGYPTEKNINVILDEAYRQGLNFAVNSKTYNSVTIEAEILNALRQSGAIEKLAEATKTAEAAAEAKAENANK